MKILGLGGLSVRHGTCLKALFAMHQLKLCFFLPSTETANVQLRLWMRAVCRFVCASLDLSKPIMAKFREIGPLPGLDPEV